MTTPSMLERVSELARRAQAVDGQPPFSDQSLVELGRGERQLITVGVDGQAASAVRQPAGAGREMMGAAIVSADEFELVIDPDSRCHGLGTSLAAKVLATAPDARSVWAHGDHPGSRALAGRFGFEAVRTLLQLRAEVPESASRASSLRDGLGISTFRPGIDDADWLTLNALAFADHPEQGQLAQRDLDDRISQDWFSPDDFLLVHDDGELIAFCWLKVEGEIGEFYAVAVDPEKHGGGLGRILMDAGFRRFAEQGIRTAALYVEADNAPALALYQRFGFTQHTIDVRYVKADD